MGHTIHTYARVPQYLPLLSLYVLSLESLGKGGGEVFPDAGSHGRGVRAGGDLGQTLRSRNLNMLYMYMTCM